LPGGELWLKTTQIRWHGRGGQGTVTAAKVLADACLSVQEEVDAEWEKLQKETKCG